MIQAKDLRIGNYIDTAYKGKPKQIERITEIVVDAGNIKGLSYSSLKPIPLTEEWLIKFGFEIYKGVEDIHYSHNNFWDIDRRIGGNYFRCDHLELENIKYVHQLQNLYFALTSEELTIK